MTKEEQMKKEEKWKIIYLIWAINRDWENTWIVIERDGASLDVVAQLKFMQENFLGLEKKIKESGVLK